jgi:hypothetical protein
MASSAARRTGQEGGHSVRPASVPPGAGNRTGPRAQLHGFDTKRRPPNYKNQNGGNQRLLRGMVLSVVACSKHAEGYGSRTLHFESRAGDERRTVCSISAAESRWRRSAIQDVAGSFPFATKLAGHFRLHTQHMDSAFLRFAMDVVAVAGGRRKEEQRTVVGTGTKAGVARGYFQCGPAPVCCARNLVFSFLCSRFGRKFSSGLSDNTAGDCRDYVG